MAAVSSDVVSRYQVLAALVKRGLAFTLYYLGALHLWQRLVLRRRAVVLMYHRVLEPGEWRESGSHPGIVVTRETFAMHMAVLQRHFKVLSLGDFAAHLESRSPFEACSCLVTFDDGWRDTLTHAWPLLERFGVPAVIFLPVEYVGSRRLFWREGLTHVLVHAGRVAQARPDTLRAVAALLEPHGLDDLVDRAKQPTIATVIARVSSTPLSRGEAERLIERLCVALGLDLVKLETPDGFLTWDEVAALATRGASFGSHGCHHLRLAEVPLESAREDIVRSRAVLETVAPVTVPTISYPNGSWNPAVVEEVRDAGYKLGFTTEPGFVEANDDRLALRRINIHDAATRSPGLFLARVLGLL